MEKLHFDSVQHHQNVAFNVAFPNTLDAKAPILVESLISKFLVEGLSCILFTKIFPLMLVDVLISSYHSYIHL